MQRLVCDIRWSPCGHKPISNVKLDTATDRDLPISEVYCRPFQPLHGAQPPEPEAVLLLED